LHESQGNEISQSNGLHRVKRGGRFREWRVFPSMTIGS
jgi:hypothetical protein